jgi:hypothetical protein
LPQASLAFESRDLCLKRLDQSAAKCRMFLAAASGTAMDKARSFLWRAHDLERSALDDLQTDVP